MSDLIKREDAIEAIDNVDWYHINRKGELVSGATSDGDALYKAEDIYKALEEVPSADRPSGKWISCEEPPSTEKNVFIAHGTDNMKSVCIGHYEHYLKMWYEDKNFFATPIYDGMYWCDIPQFPTRMKGADDE